MDPFERTEESMTTAEIAAIFGLDDPEEIAQLESEDSHQVCAGEWRREGELWRWYRDPEWEA